MNLWFRFYRSCRGDHLPHPLRRGTAAHVPQDHHGGSPQLRRPGARLGRPTPVESVPRRLTGQALELRNACSFNARSATTTTSKFSTVLRSRTLVLRGTARPIFPRVRHLVLRHAGHDDRVRSRPLLGRREDDRRPWRGPPDRLCPVFGDDERRRCRRGGQVLRRGGGEERWQRPVRPVSGPWRAELLRFDGCSRQGDGEHFFVIYLLP